MTTIIGIKTNTGKPSVLIASDTQINLSDSDDQPTEKRPQLKIVCGNYWAISQSGAVTYDLRHFYSKLRNPDDKRYGDFDSRKLRKMFDRAIDKGNFKEIYDLNDRYMNEKDSNVEDTHEFLLALNKPRIELYYINAFGGTNSLEEGRYHFVLGNNMSDLDEYIDHKIEESYMTRLDVELAMRLIYDSFKRKNNADIFSGGSIDFAIVDNKGVRSYGKKIKRKMQEAEDKIWEKITQKELKRVQKKKRKRK